MPIPAFNLIKAPALSFFADGKEHQVKEVFDALAPHFNLTESEKNELLPSARQRRWHNRANWACYDLYRAGLLRQIRKGVYQITDEGKTLAAQNPTMIDREFLMQFEPFRKFMTDKTSRGGSGRKKEGETQTRSTQEEVTAEERIENAFAELRETLISELLTKLADIDPFKFEHVVLDLLRAMGYGGSRVDAGWVTKKSNDEGIDGVINEDRLGLDVIYLQAKRWKANVGRKEIHSFVGALAGQKASKGVFITTSAFIDNATDYAFGLHQKVILIDGRRLAELMIEHNIGLAPGQPYFVKKIDSEYFDEA
jgi:restriction system protein